MLTAIISTRESERDLVPTLSALVQGATAGLVTEAIVADANSTDATAEVADIAGCTFLTSAEPTGTRLRRAAAGARGRWLLFLRAGIVPDANWVMAVERFIANAGDRSDDVAAVFRIGGAGDPYRPLAAQLADLLGAVFGGRAKPAQGLLISRGLYDAVGGHPGHDRAEAAILAALGRRRIALLAATAIDRGRTNA